MLSVCNIYVTNLKASKHSTSTIYHISSRSKNI